LQKELQNFLTNYVFLDKNSKTKQQYKTSNKQEMSLKKTNGVGLKTHTQGYVIVHKSYTDDRKSVDSYFSQLC